LILSVHIADVGLRAPALLAAAPRARALAGLLWAKTMLGADLTPRLAPAPRPGRVCLVAVWEDDAALERFLAADRLARALAGGWHVRLAPLRAWGAWRPLPGLPGPAFDGDGPDPVAALTLGRVRPGRLVPFLRASARAEGQAVANPEMLAGTAMARPPRLVCTFSLWRTAKAMRAYAQGDRAAGHPRAVAEHSRRPFHRESVFVRLRPYAARGAWDGRDPLALTRR